MRVVEERWLLCGVGWECDARPLLRLIVGYQRRARYSKKRIQSFRAAVLFYPFLGLCNAARIEELWKLKFQLVSIQWHTPPRQRTRASVVVCAGGVFYNYIFILPKKKSFQTAYYFLTLKYYFFRSSKTYQHTRRQRCKRVNIGFDMYRVNPPLYYLLGFAVRSSALRCNKRANGCMTNIGEFPTLHSSSVS